LRILNIFYLRPQLSILNIFTLSFTLNLLFSTSQSNFNLHHFITTVWLSTCPRSIPSRAWPVIIPFRALMFTACQISDLQLLWDHNLPWTKAKVWWCISISGSSANRLFRVFFYNIFRALSPTEPWPSPTHGTIPTEREHHWPPFRAFVTGTLRVMHLIIPFRPQLLMLFSAQSLQCSQPLVQ